MKEQMKSRASQTQGMKGKTKPEGKGKGVSDDYDVNKLKNIDYKQLKGLIED